MNALYLAFILENIGDLTTTAYLLNKGLASEASLFGFMTASVGLFILWKSVGVVAAIGGLTWFDARNKIVAKRCLVALVAAFAVVLASNILVILSEGRL